MSIRYKSARLIRPFAMLCAFTLGALTLLSGCSSSSSGSSTSTPVTLSAQVYDQEVANAEVTIYVGDTAVATTTTDADGNYSVDLQVTEEARANACVAVARRGSISLRSVLGNVGAITDTATANGGNITSAVLPSANVTNVSTAVAAIIEQSSGAIPDTQAEIDAVLAAIAADSTLQDTVITIAAAIKAVVDYEGDPASFDSTITNTEELAKALAASTTLAADVNAIVSSSTATDIAQLETEVEGDPTLAVQVPTDNTSLFANLTGKYYEVSDPIYNEGTLLYFDSASTVKIADYTDIEAGGIDGTYTVDGNTLVISFLEPADNNEQNTVTLVANAGTENAINVDFRFVDATSDETGILTMRRIIPVAATSGADSIGVAELAGKIIVDIDSSTAANIGTCDGSTSSKLHSATGVYSGATCEVVLGMVVLKHASYGKTMHGLLADSWNGSVISQQMSVVNWEPNGTGGDTVYFSRFYQPIDAGVPAANSKQLRLYPADSNGGVTSQLQLLPHWIMRVILQLAVILIFFSLMVLLSQKTTF